MLYKMYFVAVEFNLHSDYCLIVNLIWVSAKLVAVSEKENITKVKKKSKILRSFTELLAS